MEPSKAIITADIPTTIIIPLPTLTIMKVIITSLHGTATAMGMVITIITQAIMAVGNSITAMEMTITAIMETINRLVIKKKAALC